MAWNLSVMTAPPYSPLASSGRFRQHVEPGGHESMFQTASRPCARTCFRKWKKAEILMLCGAHPVRHGGTSRPQRLGRAGRRVPRRLVLHFSVKLCAEQDDDRRQP
jgi:hypothetical protein